MDLHKEEAGRYFNPRPPRGGRRHGGAVGRRNTDFNPRPPRGGRRPSRRAPDTEELFQSTPSARRATGHGAGPHHRLRISIHALREEGDLAGMDDGRRPHISIHALREEGDCWPVSLICPVMLFQSTPSARRATWQGGCDYDLQLISIHALREEGDSKSGEKIHHVCSIIHTCAQFEKELYEGSGEMQNKSC